METRYRMKKEPEISRPKIKNLSNGFFCGIEEIDFENAKKITKSQWKEILNNR